MGGQKNCKTVYTHTRTRSHTNKNHFFYISLRVVLQSLQTTVEAGPKTVYSSFTPLKKGSAKTTKGKKYGRRNDGYGD